MSVNREIIEFLSAEIRTREEVYFELDKEINVAAIDGDIDAVDSLRRIQRVNDDCLGAFRDFYEMYWELHGGELKSNCKWNNLSDKDSSLFKQEAIKNAKPVNLCETMMDEKELMRYWEDFLPKPEPRP